ncbi:MAG: efflux RND transporter periplasmic adaptor subunit [Gemmatimonadetes bacterium]|nr:efflux RND transporter periplasmic adaptor subunit [Gemmatimonadota bacterium]
MTMCRFALLTTGVLALGACQTGEAAEEVGPRYITAEATRGNLELRAEATGTVEPVREVEVKSKASGEILRLYADVGDQVERGALLAEIDPRDVRNRFNQTEADLAVAEAQLEIARAQLDRQRQLLEAQVITQAEFENATLSFANAQASLVRAQTNHELADLQLADVSIRAPMSGTIIQRSVEEGAVIQSASSNVSGGSVLFVMANLGDMQVRTLVDETDMGDLEAGLSAAVSVEAFPDRTFQGVVEKIEPMATVEQNVTMFPVIVSIDNRTGLLKPGMNAEVEVFIDEAIDVVVVPNNAVVQTSDVGPAAMALGLELDDATLAPFMRGGGFGPRGGAAGAAARGQGGAAGGGGGAPASAAGGDGEATPGAAPSQTAAASESQATAETGADPMARIQELRAKVESGEISQDSMRTVMQSLRGAGGARGGMRGLAGMAEGSRSSDRETRPAAVFVLGADSVPEPRLVQLGIGDWDSVEIVSGLDGGETLVVVGPAQLQAQQAEFLERMRSRMGGSSPFGGGGGPGRGR